MMSLQEIREKLADSNISAVARKVGMPQPQLARLMRSQKANPTAKTLERITDYLESIR
jgi:predicted transcriptional regulator